VAHRVSAFSSAYLMTVHTSTYTLSLHDALPISKNKINLINFKLIYWTDKISGDMLGIGLFNITSNDLIFVTIASDGIALMKWSRSEEHKSELQSRFELVCRLLLAIQHVTCIVTV